MCLTGVPGLMANDFITATIEVKPQGKLGTVCRKTKMCKFYSLGKCTREFTCNFAHDPSELKPLPDLTRTKACPVFARTGQCGNARCPFAHGREELRRVRLPPPQALQLQADDAGTPEYSQPGSTSSPPTAFSGQTTTASETCSLPVELDGPSSQESSPLSMRVVQQPLGAPVCTDAAAVRQADLHEAEAEGATHRVRRMRFRKTKMCAFYKFGHCLKGKACNFAHFPEELQPDMGVSRVYSSEELQPRIQRTRSDEGPAAAQSSSVELQPTLVRVSSLPPTCVVEGAPAPPAAVPPAASATSMVQMGVRMVMAATSPSPAQPSVPAGLPLCAVYKQPCVDRDELRLNMGLSRVHSSEELQPRIQRTRSDEGPAAAQSSSVELQPTLVRVSSFSSTCVVEGAPAPPAAVMPAQAPPAPVPPAALAATMPAQVPMGVPMIVAATSPAPVPPPAPTLLPPCAVYNQKCIDPAQLPEFPQSPWAETPQGAVACPDAFCLAAGATLRTDELGLQLSPMARIPSDRPRWEADEWSDSEVGDF